jgi:hypothetical protein
MAVVVVVVTMPAARMTVTTGVLTRTVVGVALLLHASRMGPVVMWAGPVPMGAYPVEMVTGPEPVMAVGSISVAVVFDALAVVDAVLAIADFAARSSSCNCQFRCPNCTNSSLICESVTGVAPARGSVVAASENEENDESLFNGGGGAIWFWSPAGSICRI